MSVSIREAKAEDAPFLAWVVNAASRSHLERGIWDLAIPVEDECLRFLETLLTSDEPHWCHHSGFLVAEVDGVPAAGLSGYSHEDESLQTPAEAVPAALRAMGWGDEQIAGAFGVMGVFTTCLPEDAPGAWIVEWVATRPEYRGRGLVQALLEAELEVGRGRGHELGQIMILSGNAPAQRAYERGGFVYHDERRSRVFEELVGAPGLLRLLRDL